MIEFQATMKRRQRLERRAMELDLEPQTKKAAACGNSQQLGEQAAAGEASDIIPQETGSLALVDVWGNIVNNARGETLDNQAGEVFPVPSVHAELGCTLNDSLKTKIIEGKFVVLSLLLTSNQCNDSSENNRVVVSTSGELLLKSKSQAQKITGIESWTDAFVVYMSFYLSSHPDKTQELL